MPSLCSAAASSSQCSGLFCTNLFSSAFRSLSRKYNCAVKPTIKLLLRIAVCALTVPVIVQFYRHQAHVSPTTVALTFLLAVLIVSARWGFWYATFVAVLATLAFNYFFLPPIGTFNI